MKVVADLVFTERLLPSVQATTFLMYPHLAEKECVFLFLPGH
jgi:hypothetical protein